MAPFIAPNAGEAGDRNSLRGDGLLTPDFGLSKQWALPEREGGHIALRHEVFNATNSVSFNARWLNLTVGQGASEPIRLNSSPGRRAVSPARPEF